MNVATITMPIAEAKEAYQVYRRSVAQNPNPRDTAIMLGYRALAKGRAIVDVDRAIAAGGLDDRGRPKLAIAGAAWRRCGCIYRDWGQEWIFHSHEFGMPRGRSRQHVTIRRWHDAGVGQQPTGRGCVAIVPMVPPQLRPQTGDLADYHILWEAEWSDPPKDPMLLRHLSAGLYAVLAVWDLTPLERNVLADLSLRQS